jgi:drug/metabolite transporter (DMT)-like permease
MLLIWTAWAVLAIIWGTTWLAIGVGLESIPPITFAGTRFVIGALALAPVILVRRIPFPRDAGEWKLIASTGVQIFFVGYALQFWGMQHIPSGLSAVIFAIVPLMTMFIAHFRLGDERLTTQKLVGSLVAVFGVAMISREQLRADSAMAGWGILAFVVASAIYANVQVTLKTAAEKVDPNVMATMQMLIGGLFLLALGAGYEGSPQWLSWSGEAWVAVLYLAVVGSALAFFLFYWLLKRMEVTKLMSVLLVDPVIAVVLGWVVLKETLDGGELVGSVLTLAGLGVVLAAKTEGKTST